MQIPLYNAAPSVPGYYMLKLAKRNWHKYVHVSPNDLDGNALHVYMVGDGVTWMGRLDDKRFIGSLWSRPITMYEQQ